MKTKYMKETRGITLIALVITIIVLLILAGVAISMLAADNGILKQAANAKVATEESTTLEHIRLAITTARTNPEYEFSADTLNKELTGYFGSGKYSAVKDTDDVWTIEANGVKVKVTPDGEEIKGEWYFVKDGSITNGDPNTRLKLGDIVKYDATSGNGSTVEPYKSLKENNGYVEQEYTVSAAAGKTWRVLGIDEAGQILIMPTTNIEKTNTDGD
ncbi:MAG: type II secretion system protein [Clostridia bacterium]|nr:type II secretion system protein [Clostridia bacterium]